MTESAEMLKLIASGKVCPVHSALVEVLEKIDRRLTRLTVIMLLTGALTAGSLLKDTVLGALLALAGG